VGATAGLALLDKDLRFTQINDTLAEMNGLPAAEHLGRTIREVVPQLASTVEPILQTVLATGQPALNVEVTGERPSQPGIQRHWIESFFPIAGMDGNPAGVGSIVVEITDRKRAEEELREKTKQADAANRLKSEFLANMSHEIRTPMTAILGFSDLLASDHLSPEERSEFIEAIRRNGKGLLELINDILDLSRIEADKLVLAKAPCLLPQVIDGVLSAVRIHAEQKGLSLEVDCQRPLPDTIHTDARRLHQVLVNLLGNAVKFTEQGTVRMTVACGGEQDERMRVQFAVSDTGIGISADKISILF
jgi:PAS domain S-box-containing protein